MQAAISYLGDNEDEDEGMDEVVELFTRHGADISILLRVRMFAVWFALTSKHLFDIDAKVPCIQYYDGMAAHRHRNAILISVVCRMPTSLGWLATR